MKAVFADAAVRLLGSGESLGGCTALNQLEGKQGEPCVFAIDRFGSRQCCVLVNKLV